MCYKHVSAATTTPIFVCPLGELVELNEDTLDSVFDVAGDVGPPIALIGDTPVNVNRGVIVITSLLEEPSFRLMEVCITVSGVREVRITYVLRNNVTVTYPVSSASLISEPITQHVVSAINPAYFNANCKHPSGLQVTVEGDDARVRFIPNDELGIGSVVEVRIQLIRRPRNRPMASELCMKICLEPGELN